MTSSLMLAANWQAWTLVAIAIAIASAGLGGAIADVVCLIKRPERINWDGVIIVGIIIVVALGILYLLSTAHV